MNDPNPGPGDPYPYEGKTNPYLDLIKKFTSPVEGQRNFVPAHDSTVSFNLPSNDFIPIKGGLKALGLAEEI